LIGDLFETMHELHFLPELVSGCDFVLAVVEFMVPCAAIMVHVFDLDAREFVIVRASGPGADKLLLCRTPHTDPLLGPLMRQAGARRIDARGDARFTGARWPLVGVTPEAALAVPVVQAGRHLGAVELLNPDGGGGFHQNEAHGLEYIAEQFAEFLAKRPIVLDADVLRPQS
jgi:GAF domain-containing protein